MKTSRFLLIAAVAAALASCQEVSLIETDGNVLDIEPMNISTEFTKTSVNGNEIHWSENDAVKVFDNLGGVNIFS